MISLLSLSYLGSKVLWCLIMFFLYFEAVWKALISSDVLFQACYFEALNRCICFRFFAFSQDICKWLCCRVSHPAASWRQDTLGKQPFLQVQKILKNLEVCTDFALGWSVRKDGGGAFQLLFHWFYKGNADVWLLSNARCYKNCTCSLAEEI